MNMTASKECEHTMNPLLIYSTIHKRPVYQECENWFVLDEEFSFDLHSLQKKYSHVLTESSQPQLCFVTLVKPIRLFLNLEKKRQNSFIMHPPFIGGSWHHFYI